MRSKKSNSDIDTINEYKSKPEELQPPVFEDIIARFQFDRSTHSVDSILVNAATLAQTGEEIIINGWVDRKPKKRSKTLTFSKLRDVNNDILQLVDTNYPSISRTLKNESAISVRGFMELNPEAPSDSPAYDFKVTAIQVLNEASIIGSQLSPTDTKNWPQEYRYLQLRQPYFQQSIRLRSKVMSICRSVLDSRGFLEIETPLLFKSTPEGAREFLVPTRKRGLMYALPQSPQQYKQLLMASGVNRYYQIAKCFRDENLRQDRQPEFTQLDLEMSFSNGSDVMAIVQEVVFNVWKRGINKNLLTLDKDTRKLIKSDGVFSPLTYYEALTKFGIDKPDLRYELELITLKEYVAAMPNAEFSVFEVLKLPKESQKISENSCICPLEKTLLDRKEYKSRVPNMVRITSDNMTTWHQEFASVQGIQFSETKIDLMLDKVNVQPGDVLFGSTRQEFPYENPTPLGRLRQLAIKEFPEQNLRGFVHETDRLECVVGSKDIFIASWVVDFPLFNPNEISESSADGFPVYDYQNLVSTHHPFTMAQSRDCALLERQPLKVRGQHYDLVINGTEVGGGSTRIHDTQLQDYIFQKILKITNAHELFGHLLRALGTGCPPHAGLAIGFDRMIAMLRGTDSIRDVIPFPKTITGADPMIGSPSRVVASQVKDYYIQVTEKPLKN
ncbi:hypothetical protein NADFUDRAFT_59808 [Nadsonia fulvescens var. elongata DSM 6958]|uniref:Aminoacyl-transfer RNA synthetases class-II family profile domain-containing protein n=1 Tax=Nadsonia fulvescens var. elongata DSM 6958 TaxID=857566 RepID=A0A1E3PIQ6_9ASCO|nr:hypothetical protein NADFUDRAFT_59808 [Nadsonia fulvescens var. elongata DSM 6958]